MAVEFVNAGDASPDSWRLSRLVGWQFMDDDGNGPFFTEQEREARRYLSHWPVFRVVPADGHHCRYRNEAGVSFAYGQCPECVRLGRESPVSPPDGWVVRVRVRCPDRFNGSLVDGSGREWIDFQDAYVPEFFPDGGDSVLHLDIDLMSGRITNWVPPTPAQVKELLNDHEVEYD